MSLMFFSVNMLNNWAFAFDISVPMHIILRSFGSVTTLTVGWLCGKRYSKVQVGSVAALTVGVVVSAWADALAKVRVSRAPCSYRRPGIARGQPHASDAEDSKTRRLEDKADSELPNK